MGDSGPAKQRDMSVRVPQSHSKHCWGPLLGGVSWWHPTRRLPDGPQEVQEKLCFSQIFICYLLTGAGMEVNQLFDQLFCSLPVHVCVFWPGILSSSNWGRPNFRRVPSSSTEQSRSHICGHLETT